MTTRLLSIDRILCVLLGLLLIAAGLWPVLDYFTDILPSVAFAQLHTQPWWPWALGAVAVLGGIGGVALCVANLTPRRFNSVASPSSSLQGDIELRLAGITTGVAESLAQETGLHKVTRVLRRHRGQAIMEFDITADADTDLPRVLGIIQRADEDLAAALPGIQAQRRYRLHSTKTSSTAGTATGIKD